MPKILEDTFQKLEKTVSVLAEELTAVRTGKAQPALLENIEVDAYGQKMRLQEVASFSCPGPQVILVQPWDKGLVEAVEKAIRLAPLGLNPSREGEILRVTIPSLSEERRQELTRYIDKSLEEARQAVRNIRQEAMRSIQEMEKEKVLSEDESFREQEGVEASVKKANQLLEEKSDLKRKEILTV